ncbi:Glycoprotein-N-acetylgalactosamine 3-beta-galactosyltransferase 1, partial [Orchesella cincta]
EYSSRAHISGIPHKNFHNVNAAALFAKLQPLPASATPPIKILCYILLASSKVRTGLLIKQTWGSHCDKLLFFGGYQYPELPVTFINATEGYENLWGKAKAALLYLSGNSYFKEYQYFLKADDDTFVIMENLRHFIKNSTPSLNKPVWFGFKLKHKRMQQGYMSGGAGYVFNYAALTRVGTILRKSSHEAHNENGECHVDGEYGVEDLELGAT